MTSQSAQVRDESVANRPRDNLSSSAGASYPPNTVEDSRRDPQNTLQQTSRPVLAERNSGKGQHHGLIGLSHLRDRLTHGIETAPAPKRCLSALKTPPRQIHFSPSPSPPLAAKQQSPSSARPSTPSYNNTPASLDQQALQQHQISVQQEAMQQTYLRQTQQILQAVQQLQETVQKLQQQIQHQCEHHHHHPQQQPQQQDLRLRMRRRRRRRGNGGNARHGYPSPSMGGSRR